MISSGRRDKTGLVYIYEIIFHSPLQIHIIYMYICYESILINILLRYDNLMYLNINVLMQMLTFTLHFIFLVLFVLIFSKKSSLKEFAISFFKIHTIAPYQNILSFVILCNNNADKRKRKPKYIKPKEIKNRKVIRRNF